MPNTTYPYWLYHPTQPPRLVLSAAEAAGLSAEWRDRPYGGETHPTRPISAHARIEQWESKRWFAGKALTDFFIVEKEWPEGGTDAVLRFHDGTQLVLHSESDITWTEPDDIQAAREVLRQERARENALIAAQVHTLLSKRRLTPDEEVPLSDRATVKSFGEGLPSASKE